MLIIVGLLVAAATVFAVTLITRTSRGAAQIEVTRTNLDKISVALVAFVAINGRLPCPAQPNSVDGRANPDTAAVTCDTPGGVVPWSTLGISQDVATDGWNRLISYRVLNNARGLTQNLGASMVDCDTYRPYTVEQLPANGLCISPTPTQGNLGSQYLANKGLVVNNSGTAIAGVAFVLISHGESGYGAYMPGGLRLQMPTSADEISNTGSGGPFVQKEHSAPGTDPGAVAYFDDIIMWMRLEDLIKKSGRSARDWPDPKPPEISATTTTNMTVQSTDRFNAYQAGTGGTFGAANGGDTLSFGGGASLPDVFSSCAWWPTPFRIFNGYDRFTLRMYFEFSVADVTRAGNAANDFGGFVIGFLPYRSETGDITVIGPALCGDDQRPRNIAWANDLIPNLPGPDVPSGNLPNPRFGVEFDALENSASNDPDKNHLAIDFSGTKHDDSVLGASICASTSNTYYQDALNPYCYTANDKLWLREGLSKFHRMRIEVTARDSTCSEGPRLKAWVIPEAVCPTGSPDEICLSSAKLTEAFVPNAPMDTRVVFLNRCIPAPALSDIFDQLYFGFTASNRRADGTPALYLRNLGAGIF